MSFGEPADAVWPKNSAGDEMPVANGVDKSGQTRIWARACPNSANIGQAPVEILNCTAFPKRIVAGISSPAEFFDHTPCLLTQGNRTIIAAARKLKQTTFKTMPRAVPF